MHVLISGATATLRTLPPERYGVLITPQSNHTNAWLAEMVAQGRTWAMDNDGFRGIDFHAFTAMLRQRQAVPGCRFVPAPDVWSNGLWTLKRFAAWERMLHGLGYPVALCLQDGMTAASVPWERFEAVFLGGSNAFRFGPHAAALLREATRRNLWVHLGRIGGQRHYRYFALMRDVRIDSIDSTGFSRFPRDKVREMSPALNATPLFTMV